VSLFFSSRFVVVANQGVLKPLMTGFAVAFSGGQTVTSRSP
jgi:hypothetical protein